MSFLADENDAVYPQTVTVCHTEISRLQGLLVEADRQLDAKNERIDDLQDKIDDLEESDLYTEGGAAEAINAFLDECERTGPLRFEVPQSERTNRAIVRLHDVVGRNS